MTFNSAISILCQIMSAKHPILTYMKLLNINVSAIGIILLIIAMTTSGCGGSKIKYPHVPANSKAGSLISERGTFKTKSAKYKADFGTLVVPENRDKPDSRLIEIPVIRIHSQGEKPAEPVFGLTGGPGMSNMKWKPLDSLLSNHDFVMVGYRGVDGSSVLDCPEIKKALKTEDDLLGEQALRDISKSWTDCANRLTGAGVDINGYTIMEVIEDLEATRTALGYEHINLLSESYGTRVAYLYGVKHPDSIHRSAMIGVNPPGRLHWEPATIDAQLKYYSELWSKDPEMTKQSPDLLNTIRDVIQDMPRKWLLFSINPGKVRTVTFALLYHRTTAAVIFDAYVAAKNGDPSGLALMSLAFDYVMPPMFTWGDLASKAVSADFDPSRNYLTELDPPDSILGSPLGKLLWAPLSLSFWPVKAIPEKYRKLQRSDVQTLLISGSVDFSTPADYATKELLPNLRNGHQVILSEIGHVNDVWKVIPATTERLLTSFYNTGIPDTSLSTYTAMDFNVKWGFPTTAKALLGIIIVAAVIIISGLVWAITSFR